MKPGESNTSVDFIISNGSLVGTRTAGNGWYTVVDGDAYSVTTGEADASGNITYTYTTVKGNTITLNNVNVDSESYGVGVSGEYLRATVTENSSGKETSHTDVTNSVRNMAWTDALITLTINGGTISGGNGAAAVATNGMFGGELITINKNATLKSEEGAAIYAPSNAHWTIDGCTIEGVSGIDVRAGEVTVKNSTIKYNGPSGGQDKDQHDGPLDFGVGISVLTPTDYSPVGAKVVVESTVTFEAGEDAKAAVVVAPFKYQKDKVFTWDDLLGYTTSMNPIDVKIGGSEFKYEAENDKEKAKSTGSCFDVAFSNGTPVFSNVTVGTSLNGTICGKVVGDIVLKNADNKISFVKDSSMLGNIIYGVEDNADKLYVDAVFKKDSGNVEFVYAKDSVTCAAAQVIGSASGGAAVLKGTGEVKFGTLNIQTDATLAGFFSFEG